MIKLSPSKAKQDKKKIDLYSTRFIILIDSKFFIFFWCKKKTFL